MGTRCSSTISEMSKLSLVYLVYFPRKIGKREEEGMKKEERKRRSRGRENKEKERVGEAETIWLLLNTVLTSHHIGLTRRERVLVQKMHRFGC